MDQEHAVAIEGQEGQDWEALIRPLRWAGATALTPAYELYYSMVDEKTPSWAKAIAVGALAYFLMPIDSLPDLLPFVGLSDDMLTMSAAIGYLGRFVTPEIKEKAGRAAEELTGLR